MGAAAAEAAEAKADLSGVGVLGMFFSIRDYRFQGSELSYALQSLWHLPSSNLKPTLISTSLSMQKELRVEFSVNFTKSLILLMLFYTFSMLAILWARCVNLFLIPLKRRSPTNKLCW